MTLVEGFLLFLIILFASLAKDLVLAYVVAWKTMHHRREAMAKLMDFEKKMQGHSMPRTLADLEAEDPDDTMFETDEALRNAV